MSNFIGTFLACLAVTYVFSFFFLFLIIENVWALIIFIALVLAVLISVFKEQYSEIEKLKKKVEELSNNKKD
ncbi:hypothetical protein [Evansella cellulosilytica]|uniref:Uncharacterized protein n=1 Tax=Evansella cellulosilytica (strain ATCC 21833 / DSM 2522 / FERM P-1141 / JCM 9156 / N-4) TaxID=649639 RepID=E6TVQ4_EVAC2|nr:hypothetical protein [Evansella cellulosilytica]ADU32182.1 hypothetical protein Bcell_3948 [Evansella cellulosilytica DSM 2522]